MFPLLPLIFFKNKAYRINMNIKTFYCEVHIYCVIYPHLLGI